MRARVLMVQGTMSSVGKSLIVTGLCRLFARRGLRVAPFKAQNMSNNAAVCADGAEIGRAQYTQALACGIDPTAEMNPVLLKPEAEARSQIVVMGRARWTLPAWEYYRHKAELWEVITGALDTLRARYEMVIIEGAGSPAELNLKRGDIVNMAVARYAEAPVLLVGDIDRGGIFAQLLGTLWLLEDGERQLVRGLLVNRFRGDRSLFDDGVRILEERGGVPVLGVIPYLRHHVPEEDAVAVEPQNRREETGGQIDIAVIRLPHISNFDDFDPLEAEPEVGVRYADTVEGLGDPDAIILPGTKSTVADLGWLRQQGLDVAIRRYAERGGAVIGICGGYQMLGTRICDPHHVESSADEVEGLGLLPVETIFAGDKATYQAQARIRRAEGWPGELAGQRIRGYEIHMGRTRGVGADPWLEITRRGDQPVSVADGAMSRDGRVWGCYLHGLFANDGVRRAWLSSLGWQERPPTRRSRERLEDSFEGLADALEEALDMHALRTIIGL